MSDLCTRVHEIIRNGKRFSFEEGLKSFPKNGIYIMFERNEFGHDGDRIVRVGTHTGCDQLPSRIFQHFENENKNRSIFRKNIGRCILNQEKNEYLPVWELDTTNRVDKERFSELIDRDFENTVEKKISEHMQKNLTFSLLQIPTKEKRMYLEARLIGTVSCCDECRPSDNWLGNFSPKEKIRKSGLWQTMELYSQPLSAEDLETVKDSLIE